VRSSQVACLGYCNATLIDVACEIAALLLSLALTLLLIRFPRRVACRENYISQRTALCPVGTTSVISACWRLMHYDAIRTHDLWIWKRVCYPLHQSMPMWWMTSLPGQIYLQFNRYVVYLSEEWRSVLYGDLAACRPRSSVSISIEDSFNLLHVASKSNQSNNTNYYMFIVIKDSTTQYLAHHLCRLKTSGPIATRQLTQLLNQIIA